MSLDSLVLGNHEHKHEDVSRLGGCRRAFSGTANGDRHRHNSSNDDDGILVEPRPTLETSHFGL